MSGSDSNLKYMNVCDFVKNEVANGRYKTGDKLPSCRELSEIVGVSYLTVTNAMRVLKEEGLIKCVNRQGNFIAEKRENNSVQVRTGLLMDTRGHLYQDFFSAATAELAAKDIYWIPLGEAGLKDNFDAGDFSALLDKYSSMGIRNLVINGHRRFPYLSLNEAASRFDQIIYSIQYEASTDAITPGANVIIPDYRHAGRLAAEHLLKSGWDEIAFITFEPLTEAERRNCGTALRTEDMLVMDGIEEVLRENGRPGLLDVIAESTEGASANEARILKVLSRKKAAFAGMGDFRFKKISQAAERANLKLGTDFGFVGMFNTPWAEAWNFSSVSLCEEKLAALTVQAIAGGWRNRRIEIEPQLVVRP